MNKELKKQLIDQPAHVGMNVVSVVVFDFLLGDLISAVVFTLAWNVYREWRQWPSQRWWTWWFGDPVLDWIFEAVGIGLGYWIVLSQ